MRRDRDVDSVIVSQDGPRTERLQIQPRVIRLRDAPMYLGMCERVFNEQVRPFLVETPIGTQGVAFDRLDLDDWWEQHKAHNGKRPGKAMKGGHAWREKCHQDSSREAKSGISRRELEKDEGFVKALERVTLQKQKNT